MDDVVRRAIENAVEVLLSDDSNMPQWKKMEADFDALEYREWVALQILELKDRVFLLEKDKRNS